VKRRDRATLWNQHFSEPSRLSTVREKPTSVGDYAHFDWAAFTEVLMTKSIDILGLGCVSVDDLLYVSSFPAATAAAALKATQPGGQHGIPTRSQVDQFLQSEPETFNESMARDRAALPLNTGELLVTKSHKSSH
jgi:hypothetical protein